MQRIVVAGCPGAGKSTAAATLARLTGIPIIHLDRHYWLPGWVRPKAEFWRAEVEELARRPCWIMDGNYGGTLDVRLSAADTLIHLDFSTFVCLLRAIRRTLRTLGRQRGRELSDGCPERFDWRFLLFVLRYRTKHRALDVARMRGFKGTVYRFSSPADLDAFLSSLGG